MSNQIEAAKKCYWRGWAIFPLRPNTKVPITAHGFKDATRSMDMINSWWARTPDANIGIATGTVSGIAVVDIDVKNKAPGKKNIKIIKGLVPKTLTVRTPSGGWHYYYSTKEALPSRNGFLKGIDVKADGGYIVGAGSEIDGKKYLADDFRMVEISSGLAPLIKNGIAPTVEKINHAPIRHGRRKIIEIVVGQGNWNAPMLRGVANMVWWGYTDNEILSMTEQYTMPGWTIRQTRRQVQAMIDGARKKGFDRK